MIYVAAPEFLNHEQGNYEEMHEYARAHTEYSRLYIRDAIRKLCDARRDCESMNFTIKRNMSSRIERLAKNRAYSDSPLISVVGGACERFRVIVAFSNEGQFGFLLLFDAQIMHLHHQIVLNYSMRKHDLKKTRRGIQIGRGSEIDQPMKRKPRNFEGENLRDLRQS